MLCSCVAVTLIQNVNLFLWRYYSWFAHVLNIPRFGCCSDSPWMWIVCSFSFSFLQPSGKLRIFFSGKTHFFIFGTANTVRVSLVNIIGGSGSTSSRHYSVFNSSYFAKLLVFGLRISMPIICLRLTFFSLFYFLMPDKTVYLFPGMIRQTS